MGQRLDELKCCYGVGGGVHTGFIGELMARRRREDATSCVELSSSPSGLRLNGGLGGGVEGLADRSFIDGGLFWGVYSGNVRLARSSGVGVFTLWVGC